MSSTPQWFRVARLVVGAKGQGVDISNLRISFDVVKTVEPIPNTATIKVYNLADNNVSAIQDEYTDVLLNAGYAGSVAQIFAGNIQFVSHYREGADFITEITAADGDRFYRNASVNVTLAAGTNDADAVRAVLSAGQALLSNPDQQTEQVATTTLQAVARSGIISRSTNVRNAIVQVLNAVRSRGKVLEGPARDVLSQIARSNGANWSIQDGELQMVRADSQIGVAWVLNAGTGLLEAPERNDKGISAKCLLNPQIMINGAIQLDNKAIKIKQQKQKALKTPKAQGDPVRLSPDGIYKVIKLTHQGDTRAQEWYTLVECISLGQPVSTAMTTTTAKAVPVGGVRVMS